MKCHLLPLILLASVLLSGGEPERSWHCSAGGTKQLETEADGSLKDPVPFSGSALIFHREDRHEFHASREQFDSSELIFEATLNGPFKQPVKSWIFVKDKDGHWYQTEEEFKLYPGEPAILRARLDQSGKVFLPSGHRSIWNAQQASQIFEAGLSLYSDENAKGVIDVRGPFFEGKRTVPPLELVYWDLPAKAVKNRMMESRFMLSREYFNPFDPDEIQVDYELDEQDIIVSETELFKPVLALLPWTKQEKVNPFLPRVRNKMYPAFYGQDYKLSRHFTEETLQPTGIPYWAFRYTPEKAGSFRVRLRITDRSGEKTETIVTDWKTVEVADSEEKGFIRVNPKNNYYFSFTNGDFFYPIGINIHTNIDRRSEFAFKWGKLPDRGLLDYEEYFAGCGKAGISLAEVWMASWTCALEWDSARAGYHGAGRYNLAHAWKLDYLFECARRNGIAINLVLAPHGELSFRNDQEWEDSPFNLKGPFAGANNAMLAEPEDYWSSFEIMKLTYRRSRYIAARWGAATNLFAYEFWSEVDLVNKARDQYNKGFMQFWHAQTARELHRMDSGKHLMSTHTCGDSGTTAHWREITMDPPWHTHIVSDAYRSPSILYPDQMRKHRRALKDKGKPFQVTEFGGTAFVKGSNSMMVGDVHAAPWTCLFLGQSATSALWWHDFIHLNDLYPHYRAFANYIKGLDLASSDKLTFSETVTPVYALPSRILEDPAALTDPSFLRNEYARHFCAYLPGGQEFDYRGGKENALMLTPDGKTGYGWIYQFGGIIRYPTDPSLVPFHYDGLVRMDLPLPAGEYELQWYHTVSGRTFLKQRVVLDGWPRYFAVPPYKSDVAFKLIPLEGGKK